MTPFARKVLIKVARYYNVSIEALNKVKGLFDTKIIDLKISQYGRHHSIGGSRGATGAMAPPKVTKSRLLLCLCSCTRNVAIPVQNTKLCDEDRPKALYNALNAAEIARIQHYS